MSKRHLAALVLPAVLALAGCAESHPPLAARDSAPERAAAPALRVKTDLARGVRWELRPGTVSAYDTATGQLIRAIALPESGRPGSCAPDMILAANGAVIVSGNAEPVLWRISPARFELERLAIEPDRKLGSDVRFTGLAWRIDGRELLAASAATGTLWRVDLATTRARPIELSMPIVGACGLSVPASVGAVRQPIVVVAVDGTQAAWRIHLSRGFTRGETRAARATELASAR